jgi:hypothetical protein
MEASPIRCIPGALSTGVKQLGREADHLSPACADIKNGGVIPPLPYTSSWHGGYLIKHKGKFIHLPALNVALTCQICP